MLAAMAQPDPHKWTALAMAVLVHFALAALLFFGVSWKNPPPAAVEVELVRAAPQPLAAPPPKPAPRIDSPPPPKAVPVPLPRPDIAIKDRDKPKPPPKAVPVPDKEPPRAERERATRLLQERQSDALTREMQQIENKKLNAQLERELARSQADQMAAARAEAEARAAARAAAAEVQAQAMRGRLVAGYQDKIRGKIRGNIVFPLELRGNPVVRFDVIQYPSGEIKEVVLVAASGNSAWDEAVKKAILKSSPLPKADSADLYQRILHLTFCFDEERGCR